MTPSLVDLFKFQNPADKPLPQFSSSLTRVTTNKDKNLRTLFFIGVFTIVLGVAVFFGWIFNIQLFKTIVPGYVSMKLNTALGFILSGIILLLITKKKWSFPRLAISAILAFIGLISLSQDLFSIHLGIDQLLITDVDALSRGEKYPGRPSPVTALSFGLFGLVFLAIHTSNTRLKE